MRSGFTLIELSIVLLIIGLIAGSIVVGGDLIETARIRKVVQQMEQLQTAVNAFRTKYNALPGDILDSDAASLGFAQNGSPEQNDGFIDGDFFAGSEWMDFFAQMRQAKLLSCVCLSHTEAVSAGASWGDSSLFLQSTLNDGSQFIVYGGTMLENGAPPPQPGYVSYSKNYIKLMQMSGNLYALTPKQAYDIDMKIDDGLPSSGSVTATGFAFDFFLYKVLYPWTIPTSGAGGGANDVCISTSTTPNSYNVVNLKKLCDVQLIAGF